MFLDKLSDAVDNVSGIVAPDPSKKIGKKVLKDWLGIEKTPEQELLEKLLKVY